MMVLDTPNARTDIEAWHAAGLQIYEPFDFSRMAKMPDGTDVKVGFSLAFVSHPSAPWLGVFACQHYRPEYYAQPQYLKHPNSASTVQDVWIVGETAMGLASYIHTVTGANSFSKGQDAIVFQTRTGEIVLAHPRTFETAFGVTPSHPEDGPHLAGFTVGCHALGQLAELPLAKTGNRHVLAPMKNFGTAIGFVELKGE